MISEKEWNQLKESEMAGKVIAVYKEVTDGSGSVKKNGEATHRVRPA